MHRLLNGEWNGVVYVNDVTINYFNSILNPTRQLGYTRDIVRPITPVFYFHKRSILTWMFNRKIETCKESGLITHWTEKYRRRRKANKQRQPKKLRIISILAIIQISAVLYLMAFIVFFMEVFGRTNRYIEKVLDYLTY